MGDPKGLKYVCKMRCVGELKVKWYSIKYDSNLSHTPSNSSTSLI